MRISLSIFLLSLVAITASAQVRISQFPPATPPILGGEIFWIDRDPYSPGSTRKATVTQVFGIPLDTARALADPGGDRIGFWDDSAGAFTWLSLDAATLTITGTTLSSVGGAGVTDGDKGSITVSGVGTVWTIDPLAVALGMMAVDSVNSSKIVDRSVVDADIEYAVIPKVSSGGTVTFDFNGPRRQTNSESGSLTVAISNKPTTSVDRWIVAQFTPATTLTLTWPTTVSGSVARWIPDATNAVTSIAAGTFREIAIGWNGVQVLFADMSPAAGGGTVDYASVTNALSLTGSTSTFLRSDGTQVAPAGGGDALVANPLSQFAATTSAQLAGVISNETGSGLTVFGTSPTLITPLIDDYFDINEESVPGTPGAAKVRVYAKSDGLLYSKDDAGVETALGVAGGGSGNMINTGANAIGTVPRASDTSSTAYVPSLLLVAPTTGNMTLGDDTQATITRVARVTGTDVTETITAAGVNFGASAVTAGVLTSTAQVLAGANSFLGLSSLSTFRSLTNGYWNMTDNANTSFNSLRWGPPTASFPMLQRTNAGFAVMLANESNRSFIQVLDEVYGAGFNGSLEVPTKNAVYDKIESLVAGAGIVGTVSNNVASAGLLAVDATKTNGIAATLAHMTNAFGLDGDTAKYINGAGVLATPAGGASSNWAASGTTNSTLPGDAFVHTITATNKFRVPDGTAALPSIVFSSDDDAAGTGLYRSAANVIGFAVNGSLGASISSTIFSSPTSVQFGGSASTTFSREAADIVQFNVDGSSPTSPTFKGNDGSGSNIASGNTKIGPGRSTGAAIPGIVQVEVGTTGASASSQNTYATAVGVGGTLKVDTTTTGNLGAGEDDLISYSIPAGELSRDGSFIEFRVGGTFAANVNTAQVKLYFDGTAFFDTTSLVFNGVAWGAHGTIIRTSATTVKIMGEFTVGGTLLSAVNASVRFYATDTSTLSGATIFKVTGQDTGGVPADNKVVQEAMILKWFPGQ